MPRPPVAPPAPAPAPRPSRPGMVAAPGGPRGPPRALPVPPVRPAWAAASKRLMGSSLGSAEGAVEPVVVVPVVWPAGAAPPVGAVCLGAARGASCCWAFSGIPFRRYSTARSGLLKAARMARSIWARSKPMLSMSAMAAAREEPRARAEGSLNAAGSAAGADVAGAGEGVAGTLPAVLLGAGDGAAGGAGVDATAGTGVEGAWADEEAADDVAGAAFGFDGDEYWISEQD